MDYQIQVVTVPVTDVDQAAAFYSQQAGFALDVDSANHRCRFV
jgi:predicted enzyme related to lactoylglutathione lyase